MACNVGQLICFADCEWEQSPWSGASAHTVCLISPTALADNRVNWRRALLLMLVEDIEFGTIQLAPSDSACVNLCYVLLIKSTEECEENAPSLCLQTLRADVNVSHPSPFNSWQPQKKHILCSDDNFINLI